ncbi:MAG: signal peptidase I [Desulfurococcaceae archaeon]
MVMKTLSIMLVLVLMYLVTYFYKIATGVFFYYVQVISYLSIIALIWDNVRDYFKYTPLIQIISAFTLSYMSIYMMLGLWTGFGFTPYSTSLLGVLVNIVHVVSRVLALEFLRAYIVDKLRYTHGSLAMCLPILITWSLASFPYPLLSLSMSIESLKITYRYLIPSFLANMFSTFIVLNHGLTPSIIYNLVPSLFTRIIPFLPRLDWFIEGSFNSMIPLIGYYISLPYHRTRFRHGIKDIYVESRNVIKLLTYFSAIVAITMLSQGYLGVRLLVISSGSMSPTLNIGDLVVLCTHCRDIGVGDVVAYVSQWGVIVHRVVEIDSSYRYIVTKGDANNAPDLDPVSMDNVIGKVVFKIPLIGYISLYIQQALRGNPVYFSLLLLISLAMIAMYLVKARYRGI